MAARLCFGRPEYPGLEGQWPVPCSDFYEFVLGLARPFAVPCGRVSVPGGRVDSAGGFLTAVGALSLRERDDGKKPVVLVVPVCRSRAHNHHYLYALPFLEILFGKERVEVVYRERDYGLQLRVTGPSETPRGVVLAEADSRRLSIPCIFNMSVMPDMHRLCGKGDLKCMGHESVTPSPLVGSISLFSRPVEETELGAWTLPVVTPVLSMDPGRPLWERIGKGLVSAPEVGFVTRTVDSSAGEAFDGMGESDVVVVSTEFGQVVVRERSGVTQAIYDLCKKAMGYNEADKRLATGEMGRWQALPASRCEVVRFRRWGL